MFEPLAKSENIVRQTKISKICCVVFKKLTNIFLVDASKIFLRAMFCDVADCKTNFA